MTTTVNYSDLPPDILHLARRLTRDCKGPGTYIITLKIDADPRQRLTADIDKLLPVARVDGYRRKRRG